MASVDMPLDTSCPMTVLQLQKGCVQFHTPTSGVVAVPPRCLTQSKLLQSLAENTDGDDEAQVPITPAALQLWLHHVQSTDDVITIDQEQDSDGCSGQKSDDTKSAQPHEQSSGGDPANSPRSDSSLQHILTLITAADVLIDEHTTASCTRTISRQILQHPPGQGPPFIEPVAHLPEHLQLAILSIMPVPECLSHLPPSWHPLALRAHHPSIDAASLHLPLLPIPLVLTALQAATALTHLQQLSLAGLTLPFDCAPCTHLLQQLPALTCLGLRDVGLREPSVAALAAVLPTLRQLQSLDLSSNLFTEPLLHALVPALRRCTALRSLNLLRTLSMHGADAYVEHVEALAGAMRHMPHLTALALGVYSYRIYSVGCDLPFKGQRHDRSAAPVLPPLADLHLELSCAGEANPERTLEVPTDLADPSRLQRLQSTVSQRLPHGRFEEFSGSLTRLTSLRLDFVPGTLNGAASVASKLGGLVSLTQLQQLWLKMPIDTHDDLARDPCRTLADVLPCMSQLSQLQLRATPPDANGSAFLQSTGVRRVSRTSVSAVVQAALKLPQLAVMHVPVVALATERELVEALLGAAPRRRMQLSIDLYVQVLDTSQPRAGVYAPLFPYVDTLCMLCMRDESTLRAWFAEPAAFSRVRVLVLAAPLGSVDDSPAAALLNQVSCFSRLEQLKFEHKPSMRWQLRSGSYGGELSGFLHGLQQLRGITRFEFDMSMMHEGFQVELLRAVTCLPALRVLDLGNFDEWDREGIAEVLPQLPMRFWAVGSSPTMEASASLAAALRHLHHLRAMAFARHDDDLPALKDAAAELPAFQMFGAFYSFRR